MTTIGLITTGHCEHRGLHRSIARVFEDVPDLQIVSLGAKPFDGVTTQRLTYPPPRIAVPTLIEKLAARMVAEVSSRRGPDYVFAVDDLELANLDNSSTVVRLMREAMQKAIGSPPTHRLLNLARTRCSFHFLSPMVEAYFFAEHEALVRAGAQMESVVPAESDVESFDANDPVYLVPPDEAGHEWKCSDRRRHPKRYLRYLCEPGEYRETHGGLAALSTLDWSLVMRNEEHAQFCRSLFSDLSNAIGVANPFQGICHPDTAPREDGVLRNM